MRIEDRGSTSYVSFLSVAVRRNAEMLTTVDARPTWTSAVARVCEMRVERHRDEHVFTLGLLAWAVCAYFVAYYASLAVFLVGNVAHVAMLLRLWQHMVLRGGTLGEFLGVARREKEFW